MIPLISSPPDARRILAIDPGRDKCGVAVVEASGEVIMHSICPRQNVPALLPALIQEYTITEIVLGNATTSQPLHQEIHDIVPGLPIAMVDETGSTLEARPLYWQANPPVGWRRLLPLSLQVPPAPIDDFAAVVLARRYLS